MHAEPLSPQLELRPDVQALDAQHAAALAEDRQAYAQQIPDPTVRVVRPRGQAILRDVRRAFEARAMPLTDLNQAN